MNFFRRIFCRNRAERALTKDVFTPSVPAGLGFVGREVELQDLLNFGLQVPGTQIAVWGESGAGKSSLINRGLKQVGRAAVKTACTPGVSFEDLLASALSGTGAFYISSSSETIEEKDVSGVSLGSDLIGADLSAGQERTKTKSTVRSPITPPLLTPQRLVKELGARGLSWVVEDFHKLAAEVREKVAHSLKVFSDEGEKFPQTTAIVVGVAESLDDLMAETVNVSTRLVDVEVRPLEDRELSKVLEVGEDKLNLDFSTIRDQLLHISVGTASVMHSLALACCTERNVIQTSQYRVYFTEVDFQNALRGFVRTRSSATRARFNKALLTERKRKYDNPKLLLEALSRMPASGGSVGEVLELVRSVEPDYPSGNASNYLKELQAEGRGAVIRKSGSMFRFDDPLLHAYARSHFGLAQETAEASGVGHPVELDAWDEALLGSKTSE